MSTLYELTKDYETLLEMAMDPDVDPEALAGTMEAIGGEIEVKADGYAMVMNELQMHVDAINAEIDRLKGRAKTMENNITSMKERLQAAMIATGKTKFKTNLFSFGIQKTAPTVVIDNPTLIPAKYLVPQEPKVDRKMIKEDLKNGTNLEGIAHLAPGQSLRIR